MGIYYEFASVHGRVLVWWTDNDGVQHEKWLDGEIVERLTKLSDETDVLVQNMLRRAVSS